MHDGRGLLARVVLHACKGEFTEVRELKRRLKEAGVEIATEVDESGSGSGYFIVNDPDGNPILVDQHV